MASSTILLNHVDVPATSTMAAIQAPEQAANFLVAGDHSHVSNYARNGNDLIIEFDDSKELRIEGFFAHGVDYNNLVFVHDDESRWLMTFDKALGGGDGIADQLVVYEGIHGSTAVLLGLLGLGAAAGIAAVALDDDDDSASAATTQSEAPHTTTTTQTKQGDDSDPPEPTVCPPPPPPTTTPTYALMDNAGSTQGNIVGGSVTDDATPSLSGVADPGSTVNIYENNALIGSVAVGADGHWAFTPSTPLKDGAHTLRVTATDAAGNESVPSDPITFLVDTTPSDTPAAPMSGNDDAASIIATEAADAFRIDCSFPVPPTFTLVDNVGSIQGNIVGGLVTDDATPSLSGVADPGSIVRIYENNALIGSLTVGSDGNWEFTPLTPLADGAHTLTMTATDAAGNESMSADPITFLVDTTPSDTPAAPMNNNDDAASILPTETSEYSDTAPVGNSIDGIGAENSGSAWLAAQDTDKYEGTGGINVVDFKQAGDTPVTVDLSKTEAQDTGFGKATFSGINGLAGGSGNDTFTDNSGDNMFEGRGGNDTFNLIHGGHDILVYKLLNAADATGGNGTDTVNGFHIGTSETATTGGKIDVSKLFSGYTADADGPAHSVGGVATIDSGDSIADYLSVTRSGGNTTINIDRDGAGGTFSPTPLLTLNGVDADLATLLVNHQIVV